MKFAKKVVIAVAMDDDMIQRLEDVKKMEFLKNSEVHLVTVFNTINYGFAFGDFPLVYPIEGDRKAIEESILSMLNYTTSKILPVGFEGKALQRCLFDENPKAKFSQYVNEVKADLVIVATREKKGFFESSFAEYVGKHTHANLLTLKK